MVDMVKVIHIVGARPNFMKIAPIMREMAKHFHEFEQILVHTGQHYDSNMSKVFFEELNLPVPDINLKVGSGSHAQQTASIMARFEPVLLKFHPDWVLVVGDVNSTLACALVCSKMNIRIAHIEAGLRSHDRTMPEEINRVLTDQIADLLFTPSRDADENLLREGIARERIHFVGNVMIDTLIYFLPGAEARWPKLNSALDLAKFVLVTLHRPTNVDELDKLSEILRALEDVSQRVRVIFPVHPRTRERLEDKGWKSNNHLHFLEPLGYLDFLALESHADLVITDSGGIQEETTYLGVPCLTIRPNTERPITIAEGTNQLVEHNREGLVQKILSVLDNRSLLIPPDKDYHPPEGWDGHAAERIVAVLAVNSFRDDAFH